MVKTMHFSSPRTLLGLLAPLALTVSGCNPLVYDELIGQAYVETFDLRGPTAGSAFGRQALHIDDDLTGQEHLLIMGPDDSTLTWLRLNDGASAVATYPSLDQLQALVFPIESVQQAINGGLARVPDPMGNGRAHAIVAYKSPSDPSRARVVRFRVSDFARTNDALEDLSLIHI